MQIENRIYPTDLTDEQWELLRVVLTVPKAPKSRGRPPRDMRQVCNALLYHVRAGGAWRLLPKDFGPWETIYGYFSNWRRRGRWQVIHDLLRGEVRVQAGQRGEPTAAILGSQTVRSAERTRERGYHAAKKTKGIKPHILVDTLGVLLAVCVTPAALPEAEGAARFLGQGFK